MKPLTLRERLADLEYKVSSCQYSNRETLALACVVHKLIEVVTEMENRSRRTSDTASCLANGIQPD